MPALPAGLCPVACAALGVACAGALRVCVVLACWLVPALRVCVFRVHSFRGLDQGIQG